MAKLTFKDVEGEEEFTVYVVSKSGSISKETVKSKPFFNGKVDKDASALHLNEHGNIDIGWGYAVFLNPEDAAALATKIVTTKYNNSIAKIKKVTNT